MLNLLYGVDSEMFCCCLATGHANLAGQNVPEMVRTFGENLEVLHLNDNYGMISPIYSDVHTLLGLASLDVPSIFQALDVYKRQGHSPLYKDGGSNIKWQKSGENVL